MTQVMIDEDLLIQAHRASGAPSVEQTVATALSEFVRRHEQMRVVDLFGTIDYDPDYDYKKQRHEQ